jgi:Asp-tRNA(Asn)/Glu-tRNA(Gln) amidotransferase A subunit family amidase
VRAAHAALPSAGGRLRSPSPPRARLTTRDPLVHAKVEARIHHRIDGLFDDVDVLLCPVGSITAPPQVDDEVIIQIFADDHRNVLRLTRLTSYFDLAGAPAISLPWGFDEDGLPYAVQLVTRVGTDEALLSLAARLEVEAPDRGRRPPLE